MTAKKINLPPCAVMPAGYRKLTYGNIIQETDLKCDYHKLPLAWVPVGAGAAGVGYIPGFHFYMIRKVKKPAPAPAKKRAKAPAKVSVVKAGAYDQYPGASRLCPAGENICGYVGIPSRILVLPGDAASVSAMVEQVAVLIAGTSGTNLSDWDVAAKALASLGIVATEGGK